MLACSDTRHSACFAQVSNVVTPTRRREDDAKDWFYR